MLTVLKVSQKVLVVLKRTGYSLLILWSQCTKTFSLVLLLNIFWYISKLSYGSSPELQPTETPFFSRQNLRCVDECFVCTIAFLIYLLIATMRAHGEQHISHILGE